jgi:hypothetical protein
MKFTCLIRVSPIAALLLLTSCDQHTAVLNEVARVEAEHASVRQQIQAAEQQLIALVVGRPDVVMMQQRQMQVSKAEATKIQSDITVLTPAVEALEKAVGQLKSQVSSHINSLKN